MTANIGRRRWGSKRPGEGPDSETAAPSLRDLPPEEQARQLCLDALERRMRTRKQLAQFLTRKRVPVEVATAVLDRLQEVGLINDEAYARAFVASRQRTRPRGSRGLSSELWAKGVPPEVIDRVLEETEAAEDPIEAARRAVQAKLRQLSGKPAAEIRRKVEQFLLRRGFSYDTAREVLRELPEDEDSRA
jgi:regulatory protein